MKRMMVVTGLVTALAGCSGQSGGNAANNSATATYSPPTVTSRADYGGKIERRFHKLDKNGDGKLSADEFPRNGDRQIKRGDKNGDGMLDSQEWGALMLARFDRQDANKDGSLSSDERGGRRGGRRAQKDDDDSAE